MLEKDQYKKLVKHIEEKKYKTPYMITDLGIIEDKCREFKKELPEAKMYYAVKCFGDKEVIKTVDKFVDGYDIASTEEIKQLLQLGIDPKRITFSNPVKSEAALRQAHKLKVNSFAFQSYNELLKIKKYAPGSKVYLRIKVADSTSSIAFSSKFGVDPGHAKELILSAKQLGLVPMGLTFHVGSQAVDVSVWDSALFICHSIIEELRPEGINLELINLGGGYPVQYNHTDPTLKQTTKEIKQAINRHTPYITNYIAEPGRFVVADSSVIVTTVIGVEERGKETWLYLDTGTFQSFIEIFEFHSFPYPVYSLAHIGGKAPNTNTQEYVLTGPSCDSYDTMAHGIKLPKDIALGDKILVGMTGAYTVVYGSNFNGFKVPPRKFIKA
jgi:ornithine decarboxylase